MIVLQTAEVGKAGGVIEQSAQCEFGGARLAFEVDVRGEVADGLADVLLDRLVEIEHATLNKAHDDGCERRLRKRSGSHHGVRREREVFFSVAQTVRPEVDHLATMEERDASTGDMCCLD